MQMHECDVLVVGSGGAGLRAAVEAAESGADVIVATKGVPGACGTTYTAASDWMAFGAAFGHADEEDSPKEHWIDIMVKGGLLCTPELARAIAEDAPDRFQELEDWGADFDKTEDGRFVQILSDGARYARACGRGADTGPIIVEVLMDRCREINEQEGAGSVEFLPRTMIVDVAVDGDSVHGAWGVGVDDDQPVAIAAPSVVLAGGGAGELYAINVFPQGQTGDGYAAALRAGCPLTNFEFIQIGPSIVHPINFALSGVFWRLNPEITNVLGEEFIPRYVPEGVDVDEAIFIKGVSYPFTIRNASKWVDVAVYTEISEGRGTDHRGVHMSLAHLEDEVIEEDACVPFEHLLKHGLDLRKEAVEFAPAVQHFNGGARIDLNGATCIKGLFAAGENAGGQHGADRPGGNALADSQVFGRRAGEAATATDHDADSQFVQQFAEAGVAELSSTDGGEDVDEVIADLGWEMWKGASVVRTEESLTEALEAAETAAERLESAAGSLKRIAEARNLALLGRCVAIPARMRDESRGTHYRADCDAVNDSEWQRQIELTLECDEIRAEKQDLIELPDEMSGLEEKLEG
jgi:succinate dehydrogenase/fumarate reductase flavoprotein subunit